ncbi:hypothetical protein K402DRAFT_390682 [Aulographum hederae CBS 113979]|uniref:Uncharacterized protein n=1 Tax=Aulographum hederae CBS 113979 TaxID=1176131 RepID=A0A6G1H9I3_9PEZI|nr:hypothetical protein K402DRAFT_390682 [Aulographum hederae CBS 113979]
MCYHRLYIFTTCGHSIFISPPLLPCPTYHAYASPSTHGNHDLFPPNCKPTAHPFKSLRLERLCFTCSQRRALLLEAAEENSTEVRIEETKWKVAYRSPAAEEESWRHWGDEEMGMGQGTRAMGEWKMKRDKKRGDRNSGLLRVGFGGNN